ncbi:hypothetical protein GJU39_01320 [Pedobacter petrophilus]|uniref:Uncharacterized protein n=1 Tax=Pedobacter petrophilus TaxID=1908241 RepID=A0A7K0FUI0_9SPHI|nr:hypothetical protein [Pedobacter petrophilus]MRX74714.1 hypothetical protein [Pedobacter petrophilus]
MTFELGYFWHYYSVIIDKNEEDFNDLDPIEDLQNEYNRIISNIDCYAPTNGKKSTKSFIRFQQNSVVRLIKLIELRLTSADKLRESEETILNRLLELSEKLIDHLIDFHATYFDFNQKISQTRARRIATIKLKDTQAMIAIFQNLGAEEELTNTLENILMESGGTFSKIRYEKKLAKYFNDNFKSIKDHRDVKNILLKVGFDHPDFMSYYYKEIRNSSLKERSITQQYRQIISTKKELEQLLPSGKKLFDKPSKKMKQQIIIFLDAELEFLKELDFITSELINAGILNANYKVSLSVKQLAFYVFLNVECGIITEQKAKKIHEYVIANVGTTEKDEISEKSFKNAYYVHAPEDIKKIIEKLGKMLATAQNYY